MARIVCTSDLHLGITSPPVIRELVREIGGAGADAVVVCGDLGEPVRVFSACLDLLKPLRILGPEDQVRPRRNVLVARVAGDVDLHLVARATDIQRAIAEFAFAERR